MSFPLCLGVREKDPGVTPTFLPVLAKGPACVLSPWPGCTCRLPRCCPEEAEGPAPSSFWPRHPPPRPEGGAGGVPTAPPCARTPQRAPRFRPSPHEASGQICFRRGGDYKLSLVWALLSPEALAAGGRLRCPGPSRSLVLAARGDPLPPTDTAASSPGRPRGRAKPQLPLGCTREGEASARAPRHRSCPHLLSEGPSGRRPQLLLS